MSSRIEVEPAGAVVESPDGEETPIWLVVIDGEAACVCYSEQRANLIAHALATFQITAGLDRLDTWAPLRARGETTR